ncbi:hypothetical protein ABIA06_002532 [Bradyrhizobium yuanmingense]|uniref:hypothetical protein n=1 Tax=Bradyrhizobium yuanmingense TaxID=108015 RepID=UPI003513A9AD
MTIPFEQQQLRDDPPWFVRHELPTTKRRGRPRNHPALEDFTLEQVDRIYPWLCGQLKANRWAPAQGREHVAVSERAYRLLAQWTRKRLKNIDWRTLANKHTSWKRPHLPPEEDRRDSEDFDAEIERQCPHRPAIRNP